MTPKSAFQQRARLKLGERRQVKLADLHARYDHLEAFLAGGALGRGHHLDLAEHLDDALVEAEIPGAVADLAVLDSERAVARHPGEDFLVGIDLADVPQPRDQETPLGRADRLRGRAL